MTPTQTLRQVALEKSIQICNGAFNADVIIDVAKKFESYLKGQ